MIKVCQYKAGPGQGDRLVQLFQPGDIEGAAAFFSMGKTAAPMLPEVQQYLDQVKPDHRKISVLVNALGAGEFWGSNINGDHFPEAGLLHEGPDYGFKTFLNAFPFKHHCFPAGTPVLMADRTRRPIEQVRGGEAVMTLDGPRHVIDNMRRHYSGDGIALRLRGEYKELVGTADHQVLIYRRDQIHCRCNYSRLPQSGHEKDCIEYRKAVGDPEWVPMASVFPGDYMVLPKPQHGRELVDGAFARLVGWVAAEGNLGTHGLIQFCFSEHNVEDVSAVTACMVENDLHVTVTARPQDGLVQLSACSARVHAELSKYVVRVLSEKRLTEEVLRWDETGLRQMLGTYIDGDGHLPQSGKNSGQLRIRSSSPQMLRILSDVIRALGHPATVQWDAEPCEMISPTNGEVYMSRGSGVVAVSAEHSSAVAKHSRKRFTRDLRRKRFEKRLGETYLIQVTESEQVMLNEEVFNLEVDDAHHYIAGEVAVHNCNKDPSKSFGRVAVSVWHDQMKRIELVVEIDRELSKRFGAEDVVDKLDRGLFPDVSMGTKVPYDMCSLCTDWINYRRAQSTFDPRVHRTVGQAVLAWHKKQPIRGLSITRNDYCFPPGTPILTANGYYESIEHLAEGDVVISHTGNPRKITRLLPSWSETELVQLEAFGFGDVRATSNHPFLAADLRKPTVGGKSKLLESVEPDWVPAGELTKGMTVFLPVPPVTSDNVQADDLGWLLGMYLAEGHPNFSPGVAWPRATTFTYHINEEFEGRLEKVARLLDQDATVRLSYYDGRQAKSFHINSRKVAEWLLLHGGHGSKNKLLSPAVWSYGAGFVRQLIKGWADGDGSVDGGKFNLRVATSSEQLARQMQLLAAACGVVASLKLYNRTTNFGYQSIWYVSFNGDAADAVQQLREQTESSQQSRLRLWNGYLCSTIYKITTEYYDGPLYNFEVEEDHSYVAGCFAVHNCEHLQRMLNRILPDGRKVYAINDYPRFFDISFVFIGADKTAKVMAKLASVGMQGDVIPSWYIAEQLGYNDIEEPRGRSMVGWRLEKAASVDSVRAIMAKKAAQKKAEITKDVTPSQFGGKATSTEDGFHPDLPNEVLDQLGHCPLHEALSTPGTMGMVLKPHEFQRIVIIRMAWTTLPLLNYSPKTCR